MKSQTTTSLTLSLCIALGFIFVSPSTSHGTRSTSAKPKKIRNVRELKELSPRKQMTLRGQEAIRLSRVLRIPKKITKTPDLGMQTDMQKINKALNNSSMVLVGHQGKLLTLMQLANETSKPLMTLIIKDAQTTSYHYPKVSEAIEKITKAAQYGYILYVDNMGANESYSALLNALATQSGIEQFEKKHNIKAHPDFRMVLTQQPLRDYKNRIKTVHISSTPSPALLKVANF